MLKRLIIYILNSCFGCLLLIHIVIYIYVAKASTLVYSARMTTSTRFAVAVHVLTSIALQKGKPVPSDMLANSVNTHPTVIRRILSTLNSSGLTTAQLGKGGGALLCLSPSKITLLDIYKSMENDLIFATHRVPPNNDCIVGRNILPILSTVMNEAQKALEDKLNNILLSEVVFDVAERGITHGGALISL
jgi:Rrf2 family protein